MNEFKLPNGVVLNNVRYQNVTLDEITGKQQNYLVNTKYKSPVDHIERLLGDLMVDLRDDNNNSIFPAVDRRHLIVQLMQIEDLQFMLVKLREISFGERYFFEKLECPHCKARNHAQIDLSKLEVISHPVCQEAVLTLPKSKLEFEYKAMNLSDLKRLGADQESMLNNHFTDTMLTILKRLGDKSPLEAKDVEALKVVDSQYIADNSPKYSHIDTSITHECTSCRKDFNFDLGEMTPDFFALSRT